MATNIIYDKGTQLGVVVTDHIGAGGSPESGDPVLFGQRPGVALIDEDSGSGLTTVKFDGVAELAVDGSDGSVGAAVAEGDVVYFDAGNSQINVNTGGVRFGYAKGAVGSGATATIEVILGY